MNPDIDPESTASPDTTRDDTTASTILSKDTGGNKDVGAASGDGVSPGGSVDVKPTWPDDWRQVAAEGDEKALKRFERYTSPADALKALIQAQNRISAGIKPTPLEKDASPEQIAQWRQENGIPDSPTGYDTALPDGLVLGEADKPIVDGFLKTAHDANLRPEQVKGVLGWYYTAQEEAEASRAQLEASQRQEAEESLRAEWGAQYRLNLNIAASLLDSAPSGIKEGILGARLADGTPLGNNPEVLRWFASMARELNPVATVVPGAGANAVSAIDDEISAIEKRMQTDRTAYFKDEKAQVRYRELISARSKYK